MNNVSKDKIKTSSLVMSTITILLMVTITNTPLMNSSALDLGLISKDFNVGSIDNNGLFNCVGVAITCDNHNTVNNNLTTNNDSNGRGSENEPGILTVSLEITCESTDGSPSDEAVCDYAESSDDYPQPSDFAFTVTGNKPNPSTFSSSSTGTPVVIYSGNYVIGPGTSSGVNLDPLLTELNGFAIGIEPTGSVGDCKFTFPTDGTIATGIMNSAESQECTIIVTVSIQDATVPGTIPPPRL